MGYIAGYILIMFFVGVTVGLLYRVMR